MPHPFLQLHFAAIISQAKTLRKKKQENEQELD